MSYLVLARRWRPKRFEEVVGQPHVVKTLINSLVQNRIAHAYLFSGPRGVGKTTVARLLARSLNCHNLEKGEPCGQCDACETIGEGRFIDALEIDAASNRGIDEIRQLREGVRYTPIEGKAKIYIIDEVHMLTEQAFNALLKTLEEPPEHAYFCLATTDPQKVPATIISRCQRFDFRRISAAELRDHLEKICHADNIKFDNDALDIIARRADGSARDALSLLDQVIAFANGSVLQEDAIQVLGELRLDQYFKAVELINSSSTADAFLLDDELASSGTDPQDFLLGLEAHLIQLLQIKSVGIENVDVPPNTKDEFKRNSESISEADLIRLLQYCTAAEVDIRRKFNPRTRLQLLLLRFATMDKSVVLADLLDKLKKTSSSTVTITSDRTARSQHSSSSPTRTDAEAVQMQSAARDVKPDTKEAKSEPGDDAKKDVQIPSDPLDTAQKAWEGVCDKIADKQPSTGNTIRLGYPVAYENGVLKLRFEYQNHRDAAKSCQQTIQKEFTAVLGSVRIELEIGRLPERPKSDDDADDDEAVRLLKERFDARPVE